MFETPMVNTEIRRILRHLLQNGETIKQDEASLFCEKSIIESLNVGFSLPNCKHRIFFSQYSPEMFNPGLGVARFFYLLSGSNLLKDISFYTKGVERFSDDGVVLSGSSYGHRIFGSDFNKSQFDRVIEILKKRRNTKRAAISIYNERDCGRITKDIPCCMSIVLSPRNDTLHFTVHMRANNVWSLMPYNVFEFSLLFEFIANLTGYKLGTYHHLSTSTHVALEKRSIIQVASQEKPTETPLSAMPPVDGATREKLIQLERSLRVILDEFFQRPNLNLLLTNCELLVEDVDAYWTDFLLTLAAYALFKNGFHDERKVFCAFFVDDAYVLLNAMLQWVLAVTPVVQKALEEVDA